MIIDTFELRSIIAEAVKAGIAQYRAENEPKQDRMRLKEARAWLIEQGFKPRFIDALIERKMINPYKLGEGVNSPLYVSKSELSAVLAALKTSQIINKY